MKCICQYYLLIVCILFCTSVSSNNKKLESYFFNKVNIETGLSNNTVKAVIQDSYGFMWFGTRNKLNRYDGSSVKIFDCNDPIAKHSNNNISALFEDTNKHLWIGTDKGIFLFNPIKESFSFFAKSTSEGITINDWVSEIQADNDNNIWIIVPNQGIFRYNIVSKQLFCYTVENGSALTQGGAQCMIIDKNGRIWIGSNGGGVYLYNKEKDNFIQNLGDKNGNSLKDCSIYAICDYGEELLIGIHDGKLMKLNKKRNTLTDVNAKNVHYKIIRYISYIDDEIWVATSNGLYIINELTNSEIRIQEDPMDSKSLSDNMIHKIYRDKEDGIWLTTNYGGVNYLSNQSINFNRYVLLSKRNSISSRQIGQLREDAYGNIWIGTEDAGIDIYNPRTGEFKRLGIDIGKPLQYQKIVSLYMDDKYAWIGYFKNGLGIVDYNTYQVRHYSGEALGLNEPSIYAICEDHLGKLWIGNGWEVFIGNKDTKKFDIQPPSKRSFIHDIVEDSEGNIWVATMGNGVYKYNPETREPEHYIHDVADEKSLSSNAVGDMSIDSYGNVWFATDRGGICRYNKQTDDFTTYSIKDGLPDDVTYKILEDKNHNLWFGTNNGLVRFNPETKAIKIFKQGNGLPGNQFNYKSALASSSGIFYFGGLNGLVSFDPYEYQENKYIPPVYITKLTIYNKEIGTETENSPLDKSIIHTHKIVLQHNQSNLKFDFVSLSYTASEENMYAYKMDGVDPQWIYTNNNHSISYAKLPPGKYTFKVKGSNNDGVWNDEGNYINIEILPPWWLSGVAYFIYFIIIISLLVYTFYWYTKKQEMRNKEKQKIFEAEKEKELFTSKVDFYTDIAHEIRTPVTLINGPLESLLDMNIPDKVIQKNLHIMQKNTTELLNLINQLLDFRKIDINKFLLTLKNINIYSVLHDIYLRFEPIANQEHKKIRINVSDKNLYIPVDQDALIKILNNLFSNAIKYSDKIINIKIKQDDTYAIIRFSNDGNLIPAELSERIFDPFYQLEKTKNRNASSGIGLSIARSLAEQHHGYLYCDTDEETTTFVLKLPLTQANVAESSTSEEYINEENGINDDKQNQEIVLIVEDNQEMLSFIAEKLQEHFVVEVALDGESALKLIGEKRIDIIISDVMMPGMDGFELCEKIKTNIDYSHIPVVLLTAKNDLESKIKGLKSGADAYIEKPFSANYLISQLIALLENRKREKIAFMQKPFLAVQQVSMNKADEQFMNKLVNHIHDNIIDTNFNVEKLAELVNVSRSSLHRKVRALTGLPPTDFIRLIRLKKAAEMIIENDYNINEVCYLVGINSPSYFIKIFSKQFGMTPKEFKNQNHK
ncbi:MAG: two-component regulator propeller domain-containing protein [Dysgonomonas sp.]|nr:two-component regulator propeller domain-containing protein [Dysgonomonas sp.]